MVNFVFFAKKKIRTSSSKINGKEQIDVRPTVPVFSFAVSVWEQMKTGGVDRPAKESIKASLKENKAKLKSKLLLKS